MWVIEKIEISGGFLPGLSVSIPQGLTCIIGARGSGKSTLVEAVRFALCGISAAPKHCADLIQANLAGGALVTITALADGSNRYTLLGRMGRIPSSGGLYGLGDSFIQTPPLGAATSQVGALTNGLPQAMARSMQKFPTS